MPRDSLSSPSASLTCYDCEPRELLDWHEHRNLSFCFITKGQYQETNQSRSFPCRPGDVVIKPGRKLHQNFMSQQGTVCWLLEVSEESLTPSAALFERELPGPVQDYHLARLGLEVREEFHTPDEFSAVMVESIAMRAVIAGLRLLKDHSRKRNEVEALRESIDAAIERGDLSTQYLSLSEKKTVSRRFYEMEGCTMSGYISRRRAFRAFGELLNSDHSLADIAHHCGFYDQAHFTKTFSALFGITPGRLRSRMK
jgi:AraC family transcriptional regulator